MNNDMDWKEMTEQPAEGTFDKIQRRLRLRRALRIGLPTVAVVAVAVGAYLISAQPAQTESATVAGGDVALAMPMQHTYVTTMDKNDERSVIGDKSAAAPGSPLPTSDIDLAALMPTTAPQVAQVQPPSTAGSVSVCDPPAWTDDESVPQEVRDRLLQEAIDSLFADVADGDKENSSPLSTVNSPLSPKAGEPTPEPYHEDDLLWAPNIITPGGDVDENRVFSIKASSTLSQFVIHIYNRRGQRIFSSTDPEFVWDATYNGAAVPQGAFVWVASFRDGEGKARTETGTVVVVR